MSKASPSQNSSVETICAPGTARASVDFPAAPRPPMPTRTRPPPLRSAAASISSITGRGSTVERYPQRMEKLRLGGMALSNGVLVHGPTAWGAAVRAADGSIRSASGVKRRFAPGVTTPFVRGPLRLAEAFSVLPDVRRALPEARFPFERPRVAARRRRRCSRGRPRPPLEPRARRARGHRRVRVARPGGGRPPWRRARPLPRCRAHLDRDVRDGPPRDEGARPLRRAPRRPAAPHHGRGQRACCAGARAGPPDRACPRRGRRRRRCGRDLRVDGAPSRESRRRARSRAPGTSCRPASRRQSRRRLSSRSPRPRSRPAWRPKRPHDRAAAAARERGSTPRSSTFRSRRCGRGTTPTRTSTTRAARSSPTGTTRGS